MTNKGTYIDFNGKTTEYGYESRISLSQKANFVMEVAGMVVSGEIGYASILKDAIFNYCLIKYFTDIELFENPDDFSLDMIDEFCMKNKESVVDVVVKAINESEYNALAKACDEAIEYRKMHYNDFKDEISELLQVVREFVVKPDQMNELLSALTNAVKVFAEKGDIDMETINKLAGIIPIMNEMGSKEVAKAIVENFHQNDKLVQQSKPKNRGRKPKTAVDKSNMEVVK